MRAFDGPAIHDAALDTSSSTATVIGLPALAARNAAFSAIGWILPPGRDRTMRGTDQ
jgi:hypothetical protein